jgi:hypothetical protein
MAVQRGWQAREPISASQGHWVFGYTLPDTRHKPRLYAELNRGSGDRDPHDGVHGAFDPLFPGTHDRWGAADQFCWTNLVHARSGMQYKVREGLTLGAAYDSFWLANRHDGVYSGGKVIIASNGTAGNHIGQEGDLQAQWSPVRRTAVDVAFGRVFPGEFLRGAGRESAYTCFFLGVAQRF